MPWIGPGQSYAPYGWKSTADDMAELLRQLQIPKVILLGHDWYGFAFYLLSFTADVGDNLGMVEVDARDDGSSPAITSAVKERR